MGGYVSLLLELAQSITTSQQVTQAWACSIQGDHRDTGPSPACGEPPVKLGRPGEGGEGSCEEPVLISVRAEARAARL